MQAMLGRTYDEQVCSVARALEVVGERWTLLVIRDAFLGVRRFEDFQRSLGVSRPVLAERLARLVDEGVLERRRYQERPERFEYRLTDKGRGLWKVIAHLLMWGDEHYPATGGPPRLLVHRDCGGRVDGHLRCERCGKDLEAGDSRLVPGPGLAQAA
jgi:DNA-binding HxlR family transcriptional regulator